VAGGEHYGGFRRDTLVASTDAQVEKEPVMSLNRLFDTFERIRDTAVWKTAFGEAQIVGDRTIIPVAQVGYAFGMGFGESAEPPAEGDDLPLTDGGGGGGGTASSKPLGAIVVTPDCVYFEPIRDEGKIALATLAVGAWSVLQITKTLKAMFDR
jgi:uncharacterized spore protein YtfJ